MFENFNQSYLIYIGIGIVIVLVAFFAYQELTKHKMEIQKLRYESEKLRKIIHAYNMRQWQQDPSEEPIDEDSDESTDEDSEEPETDVRLPSAPSASGTAAIAAASHQVQEILQETLSSVAAAAPASSVTVVKEPNAPATIKFVPNPAKQKPAAIVTPRVVVPSVTNGFGGASQIVGATDSLITGQPSVSFLDSTVHEQDPADDLPDVESFGGSSNKQTENDVDQKGIVFDDELAPPVEVVVEFDAKSDDNKFENDEGDAREDDRGEDQGEDEDREDQGEGDEYCSVILKSGIQKGQPCGKKTKVGKWCAMHYKSIHANNASSAIDSML